jgi:hypothetical protein
MGGKGSGRPGPPCDPSNSWQRGSNENTNGLLRQYYPQRHGSVGCQPGSTGLGRQKAQYPTPANTSLENPSVYSSIQCFADRMSPL